MSSNCPAGWREIRLGDECRIEIGGTPSRADPSYWSDDGHNWASISDLLQPEVTETKERISSLGVAKSNVKRVPKGTVMMSFKLTIGRTSVAGIDLYTNEAIAAFYPNELFEPRFLFYWLPYWIKNVQTDKAIKGATLNKEKLKNISGFLPPVHEQVAIMNLLDSIDRAIAANATLVHFSPVNPVGQLHKLRSEVSAQVLLGVRLLET